MLLTDRLWNGIIQMTSDRIFCRVILVCLSSYLFWCLHFLTNLFLVLRGLRSELMHSVSVMNKWHRFDAGLYDGACWTMLHLTSNVPPWFFILQDFFWYFCGVFKFYEKNISHIARCRHAIIGYGILSRERENVARNAHFYKNGWYHLTSSSTTSVSV